LRQTGHRIAIESETSHDLIPVPFGGRDWLGPRRYADEYAEIGHSRTNQHFGASAWGDDARIGIETGAMTPWLVHELRNLGLEVVCLDARHARAALKMQINKTDQNDAEGLAQIVRTGWYRSVHVKSFESHRLRALLSARIQLVGMTTRLSNHIRGVLKTFGLLPGAMRGMPFDRKVEEPSFKINARRPTRLL
jgi:transposase